jgi:HD-like signal output (HDOD) protein
MQTNLLEEISLEPASYARKSIFEILEDPEATAVLPSLQAVISELEALTQSGDARLEEITRLVRLDQSMSLHVLRIANSAYYGPAHPIVDVQSAILYIGLNTLRGAVASTRCIETTCHIRPGVMDWTEFWIHAAGVGQMTLHLASRLREPGLPLESFYLMGLLHDIGKVVLACLMPDDFNEIYERAATGEAAPSALEVEVLGVDHGLLGAWYLERQGIPLTVREPVRFHHSGVLEDKAHFRHAALIRLADRLVLDFELGQSGNHAPAVDPFESDEWKWYVENCDLDAADQYALKPALIKQLAQTSDLVREIIQGASTHFAP